MRLSFKYKFILSFVTIELFFISLIVFYNFSSSKSLSDSLTNVNIESSSKLFAEIIKTPLLVNDLATIDNAVSSFSKLNHIVAVRIVNTKNILLSHFNDNNEFKNIFDENISNIQKEGRIFQLKSFPIILDEQKLANVQVLYELSDINKIITDNENRTFFLIILEILFSTLIAFLVGYRLTKRLTVLTNLAEKISNNEKLYIQKDMKIIDEVSILTNALSTMQEKIFERNYQLKQTAKNLRQEISFHNALFNNTNCAIIILDNNYKVVSINERVNNLTGYTKSELEEKFVWDIYINKNVKQKITEQNIENYPKEYENSLISKFEDSPLHTWSNSFIFDEYGKVEYIVSIGIDISAIKEVHQKLKKYVTLVNENIMISRTDLEGKITSVSKAFCRISGFSIDELLGQSHVVMRHEDTPIEVYEDLWKTITSGNIWKSEVKNKTKGGSFYWTDSTIYPDYDNNGNIIGYYAIRHDITDKKYIENLSITDPLTKLYNRRYFNEIFYKELNRAKNDRTIFCLLTMDVDYFKLYNDTFGHQEGDVVLESISKVLLENFKREGDFAFRMGGEEFSAIFTTSQKDNIFLFSDKLRKSVEELEIKHEKNLASQFVTVSIGVVYVDFTKYFQSIEQSVLYKYSDELLYKAKVNGKNIVFVEEYDKLHNFNYKN